LCFFRLLTVHSFNVSHCLFSFALFDAEVNGLLGVYEHVKSNYENLEGALDSINDHPIFGVHEFSWVLWDAHAKQEHEENA